MRRPTGRADVQRQLRATYRVQLHAGFDFAAAAAIADYLAALGVSHLYCSPYLQAAKGSTHGYDIVDPRAVNRELGGAAGHARLSEALRSAGLGQVLDIVPNHMAISADNPWWWDVLENGPASPYASYFDVDWDPPETRLRNVVLLPVLADHSAACSSAAICAWLETAWRSRSGITTTCSRSRRSHSTSCWRPRPSGRDPRRSRSSPTR